MTVTARHGGWHNLMTGESELGGFGRRKENAQKVAMGSEGGNQLGLQAQWYKGTGGKPGHDSRGCRENSVGIVRFPWARVKGTFRRGCGYQWFHWWRFQVLGSSQDRIGNIRNFVGMGVPTTNTSVHHYTGGASQLRKTRKGLRMRKKQNILFSDNCLIKKY